MSGLGSVTTSLKLRQSIVVLDTVRQLHSRPQRSLEVASCKLRPSIVADVARLELWGAVRKQDRRGLRVDGGWRISAFCGIQSCSFVAYKTEGGREELQMRDIGRKTEGLLFDC